MLKTKARLEKFKNKGEKTGWTYISISAEQAYKLEPQTKKSFRVKGKIDDHPIQQVALLPMGEGHFIMPINKEMRKGIRKVAGDEVTLVLALDRSDFNWSADFLQCLEDEPKALRHFKTLPVSHQKYFSKWIDAARTDDTKTKRIMQSIQGLSMGLGYGEMINYFKKNK